MCDRIRMVVRAVGEVAIQAIWERQPDMSIERTAHPYIVRDSAIYGGEPIVESTRTGVRHIILQFQSGRDPEEIASIHRL